MKGGEGYMDENEIIKTLEKQLQLLSERSAEKCVSAQELLALTRAMNETASYLLSRLSKVV